MKGKLYLTPVPIGNYDDITLRALKILKFVDVVICEEIKIGKRILNKYKIEKELLALNEHNEEKASDEVLSLLLNGKNLALISDAGTPLFSDPGFILVSKCIMNNVEIVPLPGASSLLPALTASGFNIRRFYYYGWLSPNNNRRKQELHKLKKIKELIILLETPYRLKQLLLDCRKILGAGKNAVLAYKLTMPEEKIIRGTLEDIVDFVEEKRLKGEFVLIINNRK